MGPGTHGTEHMCSEHMVRWVKCFVRLGLEKESDVCGEPRPPTPNLPPGYSNAHNGRKWRTVALRATPKSLS